MKRALPWRLAEREVWRATNAWREATAAHRRAEDTLFAAIMATPSSIPSDLDALRLKVEKTGEASAFATSAYYAARDAARAEGVAL